jgi:hypothetical protein
MNPFEDLIKIQQIIKENQTTENNKNIFAEVFTPTILINEILDNLPMDVWTNSTLKWLDPCAGRGNFFLLVGHRLMNGLSSSFPNKHERMQHIIKHMLYFVEINPINVAILKKTFGPNANIVCGDFLKLYGDNYNGNNNTTPFTKWNIILQNPPYQMPKKHKYMGSKGGSTLWDKFIMISLKILDANGIIAAITPANWRRPQHPLYEILTPNLLYLHIYDKKKGIELFGVQTRFDIFIFSKNTYKNPLIIDEKGKEHRNLQPNEWVFFPNYGYNTIKKHFAVLKKQTKKNTFHNNIIYDSNAYNSKNLLKRKTAKYKYPVVHTITKKGPGIRYASLKKGHIGIPKVILNFNEKQYPINDWKGKYGMSQLSFGIPIDEPNKTKTKKRGNNIVNTINSPDFKEIIKSTKWGSFQTDHRMFEYMFV